VRPRLAVGIVSLFAAFGLVACGDTTVLSPVVPTATMEPPDTVVGVELRCDVQANDVWHEYWGRICVDSFPNASQIIRDGSFATISSAPATGSVPIAASRRQVLTIRTAGGNT
jgi:hypothetical protein